MTGTSKSPTYEQVPFRTVVPKSDLFVNWQSESNIVHPWKFTIQMFVTWGLTVWKNKVEEYH